MAKQIIVWTDLPKRYNLFTKRHAMMVSLDDGKVIMHYGVNTKINFVQEAMFEGERYFRTESAKNRGLNWAIKAASFELPKDDIASLVPSENSSMKKFSTLNSSPNKKTPKKSEKPKSEGAISDDKKKSIISAFKRFFRRK